MQPDHRRPGGPVDPRDVLSSIGEVVYSWDLASDELRWGPNVEEILAAVPRECLSKGLGFARLVEPGAGRSRYDAIMEASGADLGDGVPYRTRYALLVGERKMWVEDTGRWFAGIDGSAARARGVLRLERPVSAEDLSPASHAVMDRATLVQRLDEIIAEQMPAQRPVVVLCAAIDDLTELNVDFGHEATDQILAVVQERLRSVMRRRDRLVRYSSNRFAIILTGCPVAQIEIAARRFARAVSRAAIETSRGVALTRIKIGAAHAPDLTRHAGSLLSAAEAALIDARQGPAETIIVARRAEAVGALAAPQLDQAALSALNERRIRLARQPIVHAVTRSLAFHEALVRIEQPEGGFFAPGDLLPILERRGLVRLFDHRVLELAIDGLAAEPQCRLSVNVSPLSLNDPVWLDALGALLKTHPGVAQRLVVEVTETATISHEREVMRVLEAIKALGCRWPSTISARATPRSGICAPSDRHPEARRGLHAEPVALDRRPLLRPDVADLAQHLGVETVAEWVDGEQEARTLAEWGVTYLQGHLIGKAELWRIGSGEGLRGAA